MNKLSTLGCLWNLSSRYVIVYSYPGCGQRLVRHLNAQMIWYFLYRRWTRQSHLRLPETLQTQNPRLHTNFQEVQKWSHGFKQLKREGIWLCRPSKTNGILIHFLMNSSRDSKNQTYVHRLWLKNIWHSQKFLLTFLKASEIRPRNYFSWQKLAKLPPKIDFFQSKMPLFFTENWVKFKNLIFAKIIWNPVSSYFNPTTSSSSFSSNIKLVRNYVDQGSATNGPGPTCSYSWHLIIILIAS